MIFFPVCVYIRLETEQQKRTVILCKQMVMMGFVAVVAFRKVSMIENRVEG